MISTDIEMFTRMKQIQLTNDELKTALYIANQMSAYRQAIKQAISQKIKQSNKPVQGVDLSIINELDGTVNFGEFVEDKKIILIRLVNYLNTHSNSASSRSGIKITANSIAKLMKKHLNNSGEWKKSIDSFDISDSSDIWMKMNGHDILSAICYVNPLANEIFSSSGSYSLNRSFELALSDAYNYENLKRTKLYSELITAGLIES